MSLSSFTRVKTLGVADVPNQGPYRQLIFTFNNFEMQLTDNPGVTAFTTALLATLGEGEVMFLGSVADLTLARGKGTSVGLSDTFRATIGLGTVAADNSATLSSTEQDLIPTTAATQAAAASAPAKAISTSTEAPKIFDGTATPKAINLNVVINDADHDVTSVPSSLLVSGKITLTYVVLGDK